MRRRGRWNPRHRPGWMVGMLSEKEKKGDKENEILPRSSTKIHKPAPFRKKKRIHKPALAWDLSWKRVVKGFLMGLGRWPRWLQMESS